MIPLFVAAAETKCPPVLGDCKLNMGTSHHESERKRAELNGCSACQNAYWHSISPKCAAIECPVRFDSLPPNVNSRAGRSCEYPDSTASPGLSYNVETSEVAKTLELESR